MNYCISSLKYLQLWKYECSSYTFSLVYAGRKLGSPCAPDTHHTRYPTQSIPCITHHASQSTLRQLCPVKCHVTMFHCILDIPTRPWVVEIGVTWYCIICLYSIGYQYFIIWITYRLNQYTLRVTKHQRTWWQWLTNYMV